MAAPRARGPGSSTVLVLKGTQDAAPAVGISLRLTDELVDALRDSGSSAAVSFKLAATGSDATLSVNGKPFKLKCYNEKKGVLPEVYRIAFGGLEKVADVHEKAIPQKVLTSKEQEKAKARTEAHEKSFRKYKSLPVEENATVNGDDATMRGGNTHTLPQKRNANHLPDALPAASRLRKTIAHNPPPPSQSATSRSSADNGETSTVPHASVSSAKALQNELKQDIVNLLRKSASGLPMASIAKQLNQQQTPKLQTLVKTVADFRSPGLYCLKEEYKGPATDPAFDKPSPADSDGGTMELSASMSRQYQNIQSSAVQISPLAPSPGNVTPPPSPHHGAALRKSTAQNAAMKEPAVIAAAAVRASSKRASENDSDAAKQRAKAILEASKTQTIKAPKRKLAGSVSEQATKTRSRDPNPTLDGPLPRLDRGLLDMTGIDFRRKLPVRIAIASFEQYCEYKNEYNVEYAIYRQLDGALQQNSDMFRELGEKIKTTDDADTRKELKSQVQEMFEARKDNVGRMLKYYEMLHEDLNKLKQIITVYVNSLPKPTAG